VGSWEKKWSEMQGECVREMWERKTGSGRFIYFD